MARLPSLQLNGGLSVVAWVMGFCQIAALAAAAPVGVDALLDARRLIPWSPWKATRRSAGARPLRADARSDGVAIAPRPV